MAIGMNVLNNNTTGTNNTACGTNSLAINTAGRNNSAFGSRTLVYNTTGNANSAFGQSALLSNTTGISNVAVGLGALQNNTTGSNNGAVGRTALFLNTTGGSNHAFGNSALYNNTTGNYNSAIGQSAGVNNAQSASSNNTFLGAYTDLDSNANSWANSTAIGYNAKITASNQIVLGTSTETTAIPGKLFTTGDASLNGNLTLGGNLVVNGNLSVKEFTQSSILNTITTNVFSVSEDLSLNGRLLVSSDASFAGNLWAGGNAVVNKLVSPTISSSGDMRINTASAYTLYLNNDKSTGDVRINTGSSSSHTYIENGSLRFSSAQVPFVTTADFSTISHSNITNAPNYGLGWFSDSQAAYSNSTTGTQAMYMSGYGGIKMFSGGAFRLGITSGGNVGIGTTNPSHQLSVGGSSGMAIYSNISGTTQTFNSTGGNAGTYIGWNMLNGGAETDIVNFNSGSYSGGFAFYNTTGSTFSSSSPLLMRITAAGNVGIGTTNPQTILSTGSTISNIKLALYDDGTSANFYGIGAINNAITFSAGQSISANPQMVLKMSGNVGIGTTNPTFLLDVNGVPPSSLPTIGGSGTYTTSSLPGNYAVYTFTSGTCTFTPVANMQVGYIVVGGGGSSGTPGGSYAGGGGGGGVVYSTYTNAKTFTAGTTYTITVGAGGTVPATGSGNAGSQSSIVSGSVFSVIAGGGAGGITNNGGTSAGGSYTIGTGATGSTGVTGITGGTGSSGSAPASGITVTDSTVGISSIFGGGGGGVNGSGSTGGGGYGVTTYGPTGNAGLPNTGGGGGSGWAGGSGVVIIYFSFTSQTYSLNVNNGIINATSGYSLSYASLPLLTSNMIGYTVKAKFTGSGTSQSYPGNSMLGSMSIGIGVWLITGTFNYSAGMSTGAVFNLFIQTTTPTAASSSIVTLNNQTGTSFYSSSISTVYSSSITNTIYFYGYTFDNTQLKIITSGNGGQSQLIDNYLYAVRIA